MRPANSDPGWLQRQGPLNVILRALKITMGGLGERANAQTFGVRRWGVGSHRGNLYGLLGPPQFKKEGGLEVEIIWGIRVPKLLERGIVPCPPVGDVGPDPPLIISRIEHPSLINQFLRTVRVSSAAQLQTGFKAKYFRLQRIAESSPCRGV